MTERNSYCHLNGQSTTLSVAKKITNGNLRFRREANLSTLLRRVLIVAPLSRSPYLFSMYALKFEQVHFAICWRVWNLAGWVANSVDPEQTPQIFSVYTVPVALQENAIKLTHTKRSWTITPSVASKMGVILKGKNLLLEGANSFL